MTRLLMAGTVFSCAMIPLLASSAAKAQGNEKQPVLIEMNLPANAEVWFDDTKTTQTGPVRRFLTPALSPDRAQSYQIRIRWMQGNRPMDETRRVVVHGGDRLTMRADASGPRVISVARLPENASGATTVTPLSSTTVTPTGVTAFERYSSPTQSVMPDSNRWAPDPSDPFTQRDAQGS